MKVWLAIQETDSQCYNLLHKTKKDLLKDLETDSNYRWQEFEDVFQLDIDTSDIFKLICYLTDENGGRHQYMGIYDSRIARYEIISKHGKLGLIRKEKYQ